MTEVVRIGGDPARARLPSVIALVLALLSCGNETSECPDGYLPGVLGQCVLDFRHLPCDGVDDVASVGCCPRSITR